MFERLGLLSLLILAFEEVCEICEILLMVQKSCTNWDNVSTSVKNGNFTINWCRISSINSIIPRKGFLNDVFFKLFFSDVEKWRTISLESLKDKREYVIKGETSKWRGLTGNPSVS